MGGCIARQLSQRRTHRSCATQKGWENAKPLTSATAVCSRQQTILLQLSDQPCIDSFALFQSVQSSICWDLVRHGVKLLLLFGRLAKGVGAVPLEMKTCAHAQRRRWLAVLAPGVPILPGIAYVLTSAVGPGRSWQVLAGRGKVLKRSA